MVDETTTEQLAEIEGQGELITGPGLYQARCGDLVQITRWRAGWWVSEWKGIRTDYHSDGRKRLRTEADAGRWDLLHWVAPLPASEPEPETTTEQPAEIEGQGESTPATEYTPPEGWRVLQMGEALREGDVTVRADGYQYPTERVGSVVGANQRYIRPIEPQPQPEAATIEELRSEVSYVQNLLGTEKRRVAQLKELVGSLRAINETQEKAFERANKGNDRLALQLESVKAELVTQAETIRRLQFELDAAQQVPADSPEIRQLWADLAEVAHDRDTYKHAHELLVQDIDATHQRTKAETVEAIAEWLEPIRREDPHLRAVILFHLPKIMRSLAGLNTPEDVD